MPAGQSTAVACSKTRSGGAARPEHRRCLPVAALLGATFVLCADLIGRSVLPDSTELPSCLVTAIVGGPAAACCCAAHDLVALGGGQRLSVASSSSRASLCGLRIA